MNDHVVAVNACNRQLGLPVNEAVQVCDAVLGQEVGVVIYGIGIERAARSIPYDVGAIPAVPVITPAGQLLVERNVYVVFGECVFADLFDRNGQDHVAVVAFGKCVRTDLGDALVNGDLGDITSAFEQVCGDLGYGEVRVTAQYDFADSAADTGNGGGTVCEQYVGDAVFVGEVLFNAPDDIVLSAVTVPGRAPARGGFGHADVGGTVCDCVRPDRSDGSGNEYGLCGYAVKCMLTDTRQRFGKRDAAQIPAVGKRPFANRGYAFGNDEVLQCVTICERVVHDDGQSIRQRQRGQAMIGGKCVLTDLGYAVGNYQLSDIAIMESLSFNGG